MLDGTLQVIALDVATAEDHLQLVITTGIGIPVGMTPAGPQIMPVQDDIYRIPMRKPTAIEYANKILEVAKSLPDEPEPPARSSDILVANSMQDVANVARQNEQFRGPRGS